MNGKMRIIIQNENFASEISQTCKEYAESL